MISFFKNLSAIVLLVLSFNLHAASEDITYKGLELGASIERYKKALPDHECYETYHCNFSSTIACKGGIDAMEKVKDCWSRNSFGGANPSKVDAYFYNKKLTRYKMVFGTLLFSSLLEALTSKLGKPSSEEYFSVQTGTGAQYINQKAVWSSTIATVQIEKFCGTISNACVHVSTVEEAQRLKAEFGGDKNKNSKDF